VEGTRRATLAAKYEIKVDKNVAVFPSRPSGARENDHFSLASFETGGGARCRVPEPPRQSDWREKWPSRESADREQTDARKKKTGSVFRVNWGTGAGREGPLRTDGGVRKPAPSIPMRLGKKTNTSLSYEEAEEQSCSDCWGKVRAVRTY